MDIRHELGNANQHDNRHSGGMADDVRLERFQRKVEDDFPGAVTTSTKCFLVLPLRLRGSNENRPCICFIRSPTHYLQTSVSKETNGQQRRSKE